MKILFYVALSIVGLSLTGCEDSLNKPRTDTRTMIIGGVPVHDQDYQLRDEHLIVQNQLKP